MATGPETRLVGNIRTRIQQQLPRALVFKVHGSPFQAAGLPDLIVFWDGKAAGLEVKAPRPGETKARARARCTPLQRQILKRMREAGCQADCVLSEVEALMVLAGEAQFLDLP